jgi:uncharacterized protein (UPF0147 family)
MQLGAKHVESPFIELGQISTIIYFAYFGLIVPLLSIIENTLIDININTFPKSMITLSSGKVPKGIRSFHTTKPLLIDENFAEAIAQLVAQTADAYKESGEHAKEGVTGLGFIKSYIAAKYGHVSHEAFENDKNIPQNIKDSAMQNYADINNNKRGVRFNSAKANVCLRMIQDLDPKNTVKTNITPSIIANKIASQNLSTALNRDKDIC